MKVIFSSLLMLSPLCFVFGQAQDGRVVYPKTDQPAAVISLPYPPDVVEAALAAYLSKKGSKGDDLKGFKTFRNTRLVQSDSLNADLYFKVVRRSRGEENESTVYLLVGRPNENIATRTQQIVFTNEQAKEYVNNLAPAIEAYNLEWQIKQQNELVNTEEKRYRNLVYDGSDLWKRKIEVEQKITDNKQDQQKQNKELERQKLALALLVSQRKFPNCK